MIPAAVSHLTMAHSRWGSAMIDPTAVWTRFWSSRSRNRFARGSRKGSIRISDCASRCSGRCRAGHHYRRERENRKSYRQVRGEDGRGHQRHAARALAQSAGTTAQENRRRIEQACAFGVANRKRAPWRAGLITSTRCSAATRALTSRAMKDRV